MIGTDTATALVHEDMYTELFSNKHKTVTTLIHQNMYFELFTKGREKIAMSILIKFTNANYMIDTRGAHNAEVYIDADEVAVVANHQIENDVYSYSKIILKNGSEYAVVGHTSELAKLVNRNKTNNEVMIGQIQDWSDIGL